jgi:hypothetical protein
MTTAEPVDRHTRRTEKSTRAKCTSTIRQRIGYNNWSAKSQLALNLMLLIALNIALYMTTVYIYVNVGHV